MAASPVYKRYTSAVYEDKYFPEKNATIPFKWETTPGRPKEDDDGNDDHEAHAAEDDHELQEAAEAAPAMHKIMSDQSCNRYCQQSDHHLQGTCTHIPHAVSIYPLRPPPKLSPASPLRVKDLLQHGSAGDHVHFDDDDDDDQLQQLTAFDHCPLHAYHHGFSRLSLHFRSLKPSAVVPIHKNYCVIKPRRNSGLEKSQASPLVISAPFQGRSQSFNHAAMHSAAAAKRANSNVVPDAQVPERRCNSFNLQSAGRSIVDQDSNNYNAGDHPSIAAAAMWAGACILAAAAHDVVSTDQHHNDPCRVAKKLRDLMQQSANFSELGLPSMMKVKNGGGSNINESLAQLALCHATAAVGPVKRKTKSVEEEMMEAFLREGMMKSCPHDDVEDGSKKEKVTLALTTLNDDHAHKSVKSKGFFKLFKNECIACLCPSPTW